MVRDGNFSYILAGDTRIVTREIVPMGMIVSVLSNDSSSMRMKSASPIPASEVNQQSVDVWGTMGTISRICFTFGERIS
jgi:hypothetical protein